MLILILFSLLAGVATALSPCILPLLPIVLSSAASQNKTRPIALVLGLIISFTIFTLTVSQLVNFLGLSPSILRTVAMIIIGFLGLSMIFPALSAPLEHLLRRAPGLAQQEEKEGWLGGLIAGASLGLVWTPCAGPILAAVTALAATQRVSFSLVVMVIFYALGAAVPLLIVAYGGRAVLSKIPVLSKSTLTIRRVFGIVTVATAVIMALGLDANLAARATSLVPERYTQFLSSLESSQAAQNALRGLRSPDATRSASSGLVVGVTDGTLSDLGPAPAFLGVTQWLNSEPLTLSELRGKVVLIDFWTYSCINCLRTLPYIKQWNERYKDQGLVVIGVHTPEFAFEKETSNVKKALAQLGITYAVAQDNDFKIWELYNNQYWPAHYFIDGLGRIRHASFGEGKYAESEAIIQQLLREAGKAVSISKISASVESENGPKTPETYVGLHRQSNFVSNEQPKSGVFADYSLPQDIKEDSFAVAGSWKFENEYAEAGTGASLRFHFRAKEVYLVMTSDVPTPIKVSLIKTDAKNLSSDLSADSEISVSDSKLYHLVSLDSFGDEFVELKFLKPGARVFAFTFG